MFLISIATGEPSVRPWRTPPMQRQLVLLEPLPRAATEPEPAPRHLGLDLLDRDLQPGRQTLDDDDERLPVGLAGGQEAKHRARLPIRRQRAVRRVRATAAARSTAAIGGSTPVHSSC